MYINLYIYILFYLLASFILDDSECSYLAEHVENMENVKRITIESIFYIYIFIGINSISIGLVQLTTKFQNMKKLKSFHIDSI